MRYNNWDVLLFAESGDTKTPLQEFSTKCEVVSDPDTDLGSNQAHPVCFTAVARPVPTVSSFVPSLPHGCPFRVSLHSWSMAVASTATASMAHEAVSVGFEARVLVDGICIAGLVFEKDASWPQIIEVDKNGKFDQLRFPPFHTEILTQTWVNPAQNMGRIKVIIAEGTYQGEGASGFEKTRNIVVFSFNHTPLHILEDSGIAWPNQAMWYQAAQHFYNPVSPRKTREKNPDSHAHSPRRQDPIKYQARARADPSMPAHSVTNASLEPPLMRNPRLTIDDPSWSQPVGYDPFIGDSRHIIDAFGNMPTKKRSNLDKDTSMPDAPQSIASSSSHERSMRDAPILTPFHRLSQTSLLSQPMPDYSKPPSMTSTTSRQASEENFLLGGIEPMRGNLMVHGGVDEAPGAGLARRHTPEYDNEQESSFNDMMAAYSPRKDTNSGTTAPANTRVSSAANTPPMATRPSAAAEARASSYSGKPRAASLTTRDPPPPYTREASDTDANKRCEYRKPETRQPEIDDEPVGKADAKPAKRPTIRVKGRKEGRSSKIQGDTPTKSQKRFSTGSLETRGKDDKQGNNPKKRKSADAVELKTTRATSVSFENTLAKKASKVQHKGEPERDIVEVDDLDKSFTVREPLGDIHNIM